MKQRRTNNVKTPGRRLGYYILISIWMFLLGVLVGRGTLIIQGSPIESKTEEVYFTEKNSTQGDIIAEQELGYYEDLRRDANLSRFVEKNSSVILQLSKDSNKTEKRNKTYDTNKTEKIENKKDKKVEKPEEVFIIQVASFLNDRDAEKFVALLKTKGYEAYQSPAKANNKVWRRVRIGPFKNKLNAEEILKKLRQYQVEPMIITIKKDR